MTLMDESSGTPIATEPPPLSEAPEHEWSVARTLVYPIFRPVGTTGLEMDAIDLAELRERAHRALNQPIVDAGPLGLPVVYVLHHPAFDVIVNAEHLLTWGIGPDELQEVAIANLTAWSATAPWTDEVSGDRRLLSSDTGDGWDAVRLLLPDVRRHLHEELGSAGRILIGLPERHLLVAGSLREGDDEFVNLFADFVLETSGEADEPIDRRTFELVDGRLVDLVR